MDDERTAANPAPQEDHPLPQSGGSWTYEHGELKQTTYPTRRPAPAGKVYASPDDASDLTLIDAPKE